MKTPLIGKILRGALSCLAGSVPANLALGPGFVKGVEGTTGYSGKPRFFVQAATAGVQHDRVCGLRILRR